MLTIIENLASIYPRRVFVFILISSIFTFLSSIIEVIGIGAVFPIIQIISEPNSEDLPSYLKIFSSVLRIQDAEKLVLLLMSFTLIAITIKSLINTSVIYFSNFYFYEFRKEEGRKFISLYTQANTTWHDQNNTSHAVFNLTACMDTVFFSLPYTIVNIFSKTIYIILMCGLLFYTSHQVAIIVLLFSIFLFLLISKTLSIKIENLSNQYQKINRLYFQQVSEILRGVIDIKVFRKEYFFIEQCGELLQRKAKPTYMRPILMSIPNQIFEIGTTVILIVVMVLLFNSNDKENAFPIIALYAVAAIRLMPAVANLLSGVNTLRTNSQIAKDIADLKVELEAEKPSASNNIFPNAKNIQNFKTLEIKNISFSYSDNSVNLEDVSFTVNRGETLGIVGKSGSGKSTLLRILLGVLEPMKGSVMINGIPLDTNIVGINRTMAYVPQNINIIDGSIRENIAFATPLGEIDASLLWDSVEQARLSEFISSLPKGLETETGENGKLLSGGQRQRIGIARALYSKPQILLLDEATSALDVETENEFTKVIQELRKSLTVVIIAHRLNTIRNCSNILLLDEGRIVEQSPFESLREKSELFDDMVKMGSFS